MKKLVTGLLVVLATALTVSWTQTSSLKVGDSAPNFTLKNVDGAMVELNALETEGAIVIFTCNHCPYAKAYEGRIKKLNARYKDTYPVIAINPNDAVRYPSDNYENMKKRAKEQGFKFPYLHDETQEIAKAYGALKTPHVYLLQKSTNGFVVKYIGAIDNNTYEPSKVTKKYLENAITDLIAGKPVKTKETKAIGCSIKWK